MSRCRTILEISREERSRLEDGKRVGGGRLGGRGDESGEGEGDLAAKRDAVIRRYWQFSRSITGTRKRENTPVEIYRGCRSEPEQGKKMARDAGDREKPTVSAGGRVGADRENGFPGQSHSW